MLTNNNNDDTENECCICMETLSYTTNYVKTECGHQFHCSCLMKNTAHNGYGCPYCRTSLAEEILDDYDDEDDEGSIEDNDYESDDDEHTYIHQEDDILLGLRLFTNRIEEEVNDEDNVMEIARIENDNTHAYYNDVNKKHFNLRKDYLKQREKYMADQLQKHGIGMNELISVLHIEHDEEQGNYTDEFTSYYEQSDLSEYDWNTLKKIEGLVASILTKFVTLNPPPAITNH